MLKIPKHKAQLILTQHDKNDLQYIAPHLGAGTVSATFRKALRIARLFVEAERAGGSVVIHRPDYEYPTRITVLATDD